jgi:hypothetical protein
MQINQCFNKAQQQFIEHLNLNKSSALTYPCQNELTPTEQNGGSMLQQYGLCNPQLVTSSIQGDSNQHIDFLSYVYPNYNTALDDKFKDATRKAIIDQAQNTYSYSLNSIFIGQQALQSGTQRSNRYRWLVRADVETHTYFSITNQIVLNFDVVLDDNYYPGGFDGAGTNCDLLNAPLGDFDQTFVFKSPDGKTSGICVGSDCQPLGVLDDKGELHPYGSPFFTAVCGTDPFCHHQSGVGCGTQTGSDFQCSLPGGGTYVGAYSPSISRPARGCASERTGQPGVTGLDPDGYTFSLKVRLVSIGSTYN